METTNCKNDVSKYFLLSILILLYIINLYLIFSLNINESLIGYSIFLIITLIRISDINNIFNDNKSNKIALVSLILMCLLLIVEYIIICLHLYSKFNKEIIDTKSVIISFIVFSFINIFAAICILIYKIRNTKHNDVIKNFLIFFVVILFSGIFIGSQIPVVIKLMNNETIEKNLDISNVIASLFDFF